MAQMNLIIFKCPTNNFRGHASYYFYQITSTYGMDMKKNSHIFLFGALRNGNINSLYPLYTPSCHCTSCKGVPFLHHKLLLYL